MTEAEIRACYEALGEGNVDPLVSRLADDCVLDFPGTVFGGRHQGARKIRVFIRQNQRLFDGGLKFTVQWAGTSGNRVIAQWTNAGTTKTGIEYANRGITVFTFEGAKIVRIEDYLDTETLTETWPK